MGGVEWSGLPYGNVAEVCGAGQEEVGGTALVCSLFIALVAGTAREKEPALEMFTPSC